MKKVTCLVVLCGLILVGSVVAKVNYEKRIETLQEEFKKASDQIEALEKYREQLTGKFNLLVELDKAEKAGVKRIEDEKKKTEEVKKVLEANIEVAPKECEGGVSKESWKSVPEPQDSQK